MTTRIDQPGPASSRCSRRMTSSCDSLPGQNGQSGEWAGRGSRWRPLPCSGRSARPGATATHLPVSGFWRSCPGIRGPGLGRARRAARRYCHLHARGGGSVRAAQGGGAAASALGRRRAALLALLEPEGDREQDGAARDGHVRDVEDREVGKAEVHRPDEVHDAPAPAQPVVEVADRARDHEREREQAQEVVLARLDQKQAQQHERDHRDRDEEPARVLAQPDAERGALVEREREREQAPGDVDASPTRECLQGPPLRDPVQDDDHGEDDPEDRELRSHSSPQRTPPAGRPTGGPVRARGPRILSETGVCASTGTTTMCPRALPA